MWILTEERLKTVLKIKEAVELTELWKPGQGLWLRENREFGPAKFAISGKHSEGWCVAIW